VQPNRALNTEGACECRLDFGSSLSHWGAGVEIDSRRAETTSWRLSKALDSLPRGGVLRNNGAATDADKKHHDVAAVIHSIKRQRDGEMPSNGIVIPVRFG